ncbi:Protein of unknown function [Pyronema omphalodes CBS 100304]|uniref:F-box domain-containing protein n=1 Tax=Pyronema omphalodes (strain CBS 100304) TaxID=1076935 RepID=U4KZ00_PYROM|nr:Protein of unknown function [Pyronema omphalodes CBS 100304]
MSDRLPTDDEWSKSTDEEWSSSTDEDYDWEAMVQEVAPSDENTQISPGQHALWDCVPQFPDWMKKKLESPFPLEKLPSEILYIILQHMINEDYESIQALKTPRYSGIKICHRCRGPWDSLYGLLPNIFYAAPQVLAFSQLSKFTRELVINEAKLNPKIKEIMTVSHSVIKNHNLTFNMRHKLGDVL